MSKYVLTTVVFAVALFGLAAVASATVINVDYNASYYSTRIYSGTAVAPDTGTKWNGVTVSTDWATEGTTTSGALVDSFDNATPVTATITDFGGFASTGSYHTASDLMSDLANTSGPATFTIDGLLPGNSYDLYLYATNSHYSSQTTTFTVGTTQTVTNSGTAFSGFVFGRNYTLFSGVAADAGGTISGSISAATGGAFNGFQVVGEMIPEPSTIVLLATGLIGLLCYAWRKRK